uniref:WD_REPEATS_REGION domain-containing protein n=1 Tax=Mesocestoides corti TaxID=53468 RepID=A0A5K3ET71_MESCO
MYDLGVIWLRVGEKKDVELSQQVMEVLSALTEHVTALPSQSRPFKNSSDERKEIYRPNDSDVNRMTSYLHNLLITRQYRRAQVSNHQSLAPASLLLIVLDDVWDDFIVSALSTLPAAFVVTSRDMNILQRVSTRVRRECIEADLKDDDVALLMSIRAAISRECFLGPGALHADIPSLCRGSPLAASLLGGLLSSPTFNLSRYLDPRGSRNSKGEIIIDWSKVKYPSWYTYESVEESITASLTRLSEIELERYRQFVIFQDDCPLTEDVFAIYWSCTNQEALDLLQRLHRFSLIQCKWEIGMGRSVFSLPNLQLDLLRSTIPTSQQQACHCQFIDNYKACFGEHWAQLADFKLIHTYFCRSVGEHMLKAGRLAGLIDLLTDLKFICARLLVLGSSAVVADFRRFQPVFQEFGRLNDWYMYLHFLQTTAYQLINPDRVVRELHRHARSPTRPGSLCDMSSAPRRGAVGAEHCRQSMTPDAFAASHHSSPSPPTFRAAAASAVRARADVVDRHRYSVRLPRKDLMVKGLDLLQLGLMFPPDNAVFQQSLSLLGAGDAAVGLKQNVAVAPKYYWFWSNSSSTGSELVWATRTGKDKITAIAAEADYSLLPPSLRRRTKPSEDRSINRRFVGTSDGRIIILDVTSGYEVAVHQVHKPSVAVVAISLLPGNQSCLSCGADGRMIVSTLPPLDASVMSPNGGSIFCRSNHMGDLSGPGPDDSYFTTIDVDDDYPEMSPASNLNDDDTFYDVSGGSSPTHPSSPLADCAGGLPAAPRSASPVLQEDPFPTYTVAPTVLADLPSSFEIRRNTQESTSLAPHQAVDSGVHDDDTATQQCIALSPLGTCLLFSDQPNPNSPTADMTLRRRRILDDSLVPSPPEQNPISLTIYSVLAQSQCKFTLVKSRELTLPPQLGERSTQVTVATASISLDDSLIITGLSNGRLWIFSLDEIGWVTCIASAVALMADPFFAAPMSTRTPRPRPESSPLDLISSYCDPELMKLALVDGKVAKTCIFIHWPNQAQAPVNPGGWNPPVNPLVAAAIDNLVLVWSFENKLPDGIDDLQNPETIVPASRAQFCLPCPPAVAITALDSQSFGSRCFLAAGLTNGHAIIWSLPELCKVFDVCAHCTPVTSVRLSPYGYCRSPAATPTSPSHRPLSINTLSPAATSDLVSVTTAAEDGVVKAWEFPWSNSKEPQSMNMSLILSAESSPSRNRRQTLEQSVRVEACAREQPFPLWADVFSVVFGLRGEFYAVGRIKASCSLQILFRKPVSVVGVDGERGDAAGYQSFQCVELSLSLCHGRSLAQAHLPVVSGSPVEQSSVSAFQLVNRVVTNNPVPSCAAFSADLKLLAIGFENGTVQVLRMNVPRDPLSGFKPYRKLTVFSRNSISDSDCSGNNGRPGTLNRDLPFEIVSTSMKITHLSLWTPPSNFEDPDLELVVAVITAGGNVHVWEVNSSQAQDDLSCNGGKLAPFKRWPRMHLPTPPSAPAATANRPIAPPSLGRPFSPDPWSPTRHPVVWFNCYPNLQPLQKHQAWRARLAWLSAGLDGMLCGRSLSDEWSLSLVAHKPAEITDVDVDPHGRWIATASTDCTVRVWCLLTERKVFEGSHKPSVVRCVRFRPITKAIDVGIEMLLASGDADGNLRVWRLTAPKSDDLSMIASRSTISSDAAGCGGSGFVCLAWSADGGTLAGLSDRLCSWRILVRPGGGGNQQQQQQQQLDRSRVIRVFDTTALRNRLFVSRASPGNPNLPPTMITLEAQSGVCFVFDPIEMLGLWGGVGGCVGPSTVVLSDVTSILNKQHKPVN